MVDYLAVCWALWLVVDLAVCWAALSVVCWAVPLAVCWADPSVALWADGKAVRLVAYLADWWVALWVAELESLKAD